MEGRRNAADDVRKFLGISNEDVWLHAIQVRSRKCV